jgi:HAD superfamily hydrolase (TIGR01549 family)
MISNLQPYLLFDAGGTLVFPDFNLVSSTVSNFGIQVTPDQLFDIHCKLILAIDDRARQKDHLSDPFPKGYAHALLSAYVRDQNTLDKIVLALKKYNQERNLWTSTYPWVYETLEKLKNQGYRMSMISNADGRVEQILKELNLLHYFERVFDSTIVGLSKPDKKFFELALSELNLTPNESIYIGDTFFYDVWGANAAGLGCIHLDPNDLYRDWPGFRLPSIIQLPDWLMAFAQDPQKYNIHPAKDILLTFENQSTS